MGSEDCWSGVLLLEPMACYVLKHAEDEGALEVVAIFLAPSGPLYVILARDEPIDEDLLWVMETKFNEYATSPEGEHTVDWDSICANGVSREVCMQDWTSEPRWLLPARGYVSLFSWTFTSANDDVLLIHGGLAGRQLVPGWASWRQLWPAHSVVETNPVGQSTLDEADASSARFDVSDVDMVSGLADEDCESHDLPVSDGQCTTWRAFGHLGLVGVRSTGDYFPDMTPTRYAQIKAPPDDPQELERIKLELLDDRREAMYLAGELNVEIIPVKYDLGELWRWAVVLDRFKYSKANTIGLTGAWVGTNGVAINYPADIRITINARGLDPRVVADALPELLPALGIPQDAVGRVIHDNTDRRRFLFLNSTAEHSTTTVEEPDEITIDRVTTGELTMTTPSAAPDHAAPDVVAPPNTAVTPVDNAPPSQDSSPVVDTTEGDSGQTAVGSTQIEEQSSPQSPAPKPVLAQGASPEQSLPEDHNFVWLLMALAAVISVAGIAAVVLRARKA